MKPAQRSVLIHVYEYWNKTYGHTTYSARVSVDGYWIFTTGPEYGYGNHAELQTLSLLDREGANIDPATIDIYVVKVPCLKRDLPKRNIERLQQ